VLLGEESGTSLYKKELEAETATERDEQVLVYSFTVGWKPTFSINPSHHNSPPPLTSTWPHLRCNVGMEEGEY